jgi:hypothetical protein
MRQQAEGQLQQERSALKEAQAPFSVSAQLGGGTRPTPVLLPH